MDYPEILHYFRTILEQKLTVYICYYNDAVIVYLALLLVGFK